MGALGILGIPARAVRVASVTGFALPSIAAANDSALRPASAGVNLENNRQHGSRTDDTLFKLRMLAAKGVEAAMVVTERNESESSHEGKKDFRFRMRQTQ
jgi:hypothetical protein